MNNYYNCQVKFYGGKLKISRFNSILDNLANEAEEMEDIDLHGKLPEADQKQIKEVVIEMLKEATLEAQFNMLCEYYNEAYIEVLEEMRRIYVADHSKGLPNI